MDLGSLQESTCLDDDLERGRVLCHINTSTVLKTNGVVEERIWKRIAWQISQQRSFDWWDS